MSPSLTRLRTIQRVSHQVLSRYSQLAGWPFGYTNKIEIADYYHQQPEGSESLKPLRQFSFQRVDLLVLGAFYFWVLQY